MIGLIGLLLAAAPPHDQRCDSVQTADLIACAQADYDRADAALNAQYKVALARTKGSAAGGTGDRAATADLGYAQSLLAAQRAWLAYRDAECVFRTYGNAGGHEQPIYRLGCLAQLTRARTRALHDDVAEDR